MGMFATYKLYLQESVTAGPGHMNNKFLLSARKRKKQKKSNYLISLDEEDLAKNSGNYYGKVKSNFVGTEFIMHDKGVKPADAEQTPVANLRKEYGVILYDTNVVSTHAHCHCLSCSSLGPENCRRDLTDWLLWLQLGTKGPRKMTVVTPPVTPDGHVKATSEEGMLERVKGGDFGDCVKLHNKAPRWNESLGAYCLNFNGRVTLPSVKNFQLQMEGAQDPNQVRACTNSPRPLSPLRRSNSLSLRSTEAILQCLESFSERLLLWSQVSLQFGKTGDSTFTMDYSYPLSPLQAFQVRADSQV